MAFTEITNEEIDLAFPTSNYKTAADRPKRVLANNILKKLRDNYNDSIDFRIDVWEWEPVPPLLLTFSIGTGEVVLTWETELEGITFNVYKSNTPFTEDSLPAVYDTVSADVGIWTDPSVSYGETFYYAIGADI